MAGSGFGAAIATAAQAVHAGACEVALVAHASVAPRPPEIDPLSPRQPMGTGKYPPSSLLDHAALWSRTAGIYPAMAGRYLHDFGAPRELFGLVAINSRANASRNDHAVLRTPLTMDEYLAAEPTCGGLSAFDLDQLVDGADAVVVTSAERARSLARPPVMIHVAAFAEPRHGPVFYEQYADYQELGPWLTADVLWKRSELALPDVDVFYPYDGLTNVAVVWTEAVGYCGPGEAWDFLSQHWDEGERRISVEGRVPFLTNGGHLAEGVNAAGGALVEAVRQLRGEAGERQARDCCVALVAMGSLFHNATALLLRRD
jgi:acetyl-CoA acetyltransferase